MRRGSSAIPKRLFLDREQQVRTLFKNTFAMRVLQRVTVNKADWVLVAVFYGLFAHSVFLRHISLFSSGSACDVEGKDDDTNASAWCGNTDGYFIAMRGIAECLDPLVFSNEGGAWITWSAATSVFLCAPLELFIAASTLTNMRWSTDLAVVYASAKLPLVLPWIAYTVTDSVAMDLCPGTSLWPFFLLYGITVAAIFALVIKEMVNKWNIRDRGRM
jgi:hypothetical protein